MNEKLMKIRKQFPNLRKFKVRDLLTTHKRFSYYRPTYTMSKESMAYCERVTPLKIDYRMTNHATDRIEARYLSEDDVMNTITRGNVVQNSDEFIYTYKYFKVVADCEVTDTTEKVVVITAMYVYDFVTAVKTCTTKFLAGRTTITNALRYIYDDMGNAMYDNHKKVFNTLENYGFVCRDSFFGESILSSYSGKRVKLSDGNSVSLSDLRRKIEMVHDELMTGNPSTVMNKRFKFTSNKIISFTENGRKYVYNRSEMTNMVGSTNNKIRSMIRGTEDRIYINSESIVGFVVIRGARYDVMMIDVGKVSWIVEVSYHKYFLELRDTYLGMALDYADARNFLNAYVNALGMFVYVKEDAELKDRFVVTKINELNRRKMAFILNNQEKYLEENGLTIG